jgi:hypothetical protein
MGIGVYFLAYAMVSLTFSVAIFLRLGLGTTVMQSLHIPLYDAQYYIMPSIGAFVLLFTLGERHVEPWSKKQKLLVAVLGIAFTYAVSFAMIGIDNLLSTPLAFILFPAISALLAYSHHRAQKPKSLSVPKKKIMGALIIILFAPYVAALLGANSTLSRVNGMPGDMEKARFVSSYILNTTIWAGQSGIIGTYYSLHRCSSDHLQFSILGVGKCGEMAYAARALFDDLDIESRIVNLPGEDHTFVEAKLNGIWMVVDPGTSSVITREEMAKRRLDDPGGLSCVIAETDQGYVDLTTDYLPMNTDRITIRVTSHCAPVNHARIVFTHTFNGLEQSLRPFYSDLNGTVEFNLGPMDYRTTYGAESYYRISVNGWRAKPTVTSSGSGEHVSLRIEVPDIVASLLFP